MIFTLESVVSKASLKFRVYMNHYVMMCKPENSREIHFTAYSVELRRKHWIDKPQSPGCASPGCHTEFECAVLLDDNIC